MLGTLQVLVHIVIINRQKNAADGMKQQKFNNTKIFSRELFNVKISRSTVCCIAPILGRYIDT